MLFQDEERRQQAKIYERRNSRSHIFSQVGWHPEPGVPTSSAPSHRRWRMISGGNHLLTTTAARLDFACLQAAHAMSATRRKAGPWKDQTSTVFLRIVSCGTNFNFQIFKLQISNPVGTCRVCCLQPRASLKYTCIDHGTCSATIWA